MAAFLPCAPLNNIQFDEPSLLLQVGEHPRPLFDPYRFGSKMNVNTTFESSLNELLNDIRATMARRGRRCGTVTCDPSTHHYSAHSTTRNPTPIKRSRFLQC
jgi:hypothetical protein